LVDAKHADKYVQHVEELGAAEAVKDELARCTRMVKDIIRKKNTQDPGIPVLFTVAPTRIHIVRRKP